MISHFRAVRVWGAAVCLACLLNSGTSRAQNPAPAAPKAQVTADKKAYRAASEIEDPAARIAALRAFVKEYPKSSRVDRADELILKIQLKSFPDRVDEIDKQVKEVVKHAGKGLGLWYTQAETAMALADAGTKGVDLKRADSLARSAVDHSTEGEFDKMMLKEFAKEKQPAPKPEMLHRRLRPIRAEFLASLADVELQEGNVEQATSLTTDGYALDPNNDDLNMVRARIALQEGHKAEALDDFERAQLVGELDATWRAKMMELYREAHGGSDSGFTAEMDARYSQIFPAAFDPGSHPAAQTGHTILLELFTGSGCPPCVGGDLAVEGALQSYPRTEVVALAFDQHIPEPDPLANQDSIDRADFYNVKFTPDYMLDGAPMPLNGDRRDGSEELYTKLAGLLDKEAATSSNVQLQLTGSEGDGRLVSAHAVVTLGSEESLKQQIDRKVQVEPPPDPNAPAPPKPAANKKIKKPAATPASPKADATGTPAAEPHLVLNFALVEDDVRYSGENGIRFHRMVVRALAKPAGDGFPLDPGKTATLDATFDPGAISAKSLEYLTNFEKGNDRFDRFEFISKDTSIDPKHLALAAWVQDTTSHRVLQAAFFPLGEGK